MFKKKIILVVVLVLASVVGIYFLSKTQSQSPKTQSPAQETKPQNPSPPSQTTAMAPNTAADKKHFERVIVKEKDQCQTEIIRSALVSFVDQRMTILSGAMGCMKPPFATSAEKKEIEDFLFAASQRRASATLRGQPVTISKENFESLLR